MSNPNSGRVQGAALQLVLISLLSASLFVALFATLILPEVAGGRFAERNFVYRDAGHFYYPYFSQIQKQWEAGQIPLWDQHDSGGLPLAGNPTASVFYPGKLLFFLLPFPMAYRWYLMGHVGLALLVTYASARGLGISRVGAALAGITYAFSGFVFFQIYNVVFLVSAAWLPLALLAVDRVVRQPSVGWSLTLGVVLALQVLGGDPQTAMLVGLVAVPYWAVYHLGVRSGLVCLLALASLGFGVTEGRRQLPVLVARIIGASAANETLTGIAFASIVALAGAVVLLRQRRRILEDGPPRWGLTLLIFAGGVAFVLAAIQILPTAELVRLTDRAAPNAPHEPVAFSLFPARILELLMPTFWGQQFPRHSRWLGLEALEAGVWVPTIYMGLLPFVLAVVSFRFRHGEPWVRWLSLVTILMFWLALGKFGGIGWLLEESWDGMDPVTAKGAVTLGGESDGLYWLCERVIPGFRSFRYPSKILVVCMATLSLLAGFGLDEWGGGRHRWLPKAMLVGAGFGALVVVGLLLERANLEVWFRARSSAGSFGPMDGAAAIRNLWQSFLQLSLCCAVAAGLFWMGNRITHRPQIVTFGILALVAVDLYFSDRWMVLTDLQSEIDAKPSVAQVIEANQAKLGDDQPFRVHRTRIYHPFRWHLSGGDDRIVEMSRWERSTIQPKYGVLWDIDYTTTVGTMSLYDVEFFFAPWVVPTPAELLRSQPEERQMVYYPRQGYNLWNTRYFVVPKLVRLGDEERGIFTLLADADGNPGKILAQSPADKDDYMVLENPEAFPRAWLVHRADVRLPIVGLSREDRQPPMEQLLFRDRDAGKRLWRGTDHGEYPLKSMVMLETEDAEVLQPFASGIPVSSKETVRITNYKADEVELQVHAEAPGFVVVADAFYPGWSATRDDVAVPILRANRAMRAVPVPAGDHKIVMRYRSRPFEYGAMLSGLGWLAVLVSAVILRMRKRPHLDPYSS